MATPGGIQRYTATLVQALKDLLGDQSARCITISEGLNRHGNGRLARRVKLRLVCHALWETARWRPDVIICTHLCLGPVGCLLARICHRPYWIVVHGIEAWAVLPAWKRISLRRADRVLVTSAFSREQVVKRQGIDYKRIRSLPCTLDETLLRAETPETCLGHSLKGQRIVLTVARMAASEGYKGHDVVLRALPAVIAKVPNLTYVVVGEGDDRHRLQRVAGDMGLNKHVVFTGEISDSELARLYRQSEIFVLPARTVLDDSDPKGEGFGIVFLEAMAFGKPVVGPRYGAPAELITDRKTGLLVDPDQAESVAEALLNLFTKPATADEMGKAAQEWVRRHYSYGSFRDRLQEILAA
jgi:phosphatidyl-myo-inositol dimannoside synthase